MTRYLDPLDSAFILLEVPGSAMNIGAVIELDFGDVADPTERFELIRKNVADRLHEIPVLTQRVIRAPVRSHVAGARARHAHRPRSTHLARGAAVTRAPPTSSTR